jgi:lipoate-protein ligase B
MTPIDREAAIGGAGGAVSGRMLEILNLGVRSYAEVLSLQRSLAADRISGALPHDVLVLVEHPPVVTLGRRAADNKLPVSPAFLASRGIELFEVERGGGVTFHGPGQLVGYPIVDLRGHREDLHWYLRQVEAALMRALAAFDVPAERNEGFTGVWTGGRKIASIGVHARSWVTWHGFALNVTTDLSYFNLMTPCGIDGVEMTSVARERPERGATVADVGVRVVEAFGDLFSLEPVWTDRSDATEPLVRADEARLSR